MGVLKKFFAIMVFLLGVFAVLSVASPQLAGKVKDWGLGFLGEERTTDLSVASQNIVSEVLGEKTPSDSRDTVKDLEEEITRITKKILETKLVEQTTKTVNTVVNDTIKEAGDIPETQLEKVKKEVKKEVYEGICEDWLKQKLIEEQGDDSNE